MRSIFKRLFSTTTRSATTPAAAFVPPASPPEIKWPEENLNLSNAEGGGYLALKLNDVLGSRYSVVRKLGWGQHSTVWLAKDIMTSKYVSLKVLSAHATEVQTSVAFELSILQTISRNSTSDRSHVLTLQDHFTSFSVHGEHLVLVTEVFAESLQRAQNVAPRCQIPVAAVKLITKQLLIALDYLHTVCKVIHTDIKPDNILFAASDLVNVSELGQSEPVPNIPLTTYLSRPLSHQDGWNPFVPPFADLNVSLIDFGTAATIDGYHPKLIQPEALRAPEVIIGCAWGTSADIWNLGCVIFELLTGRHLFGLRSNELFTRAQYHLAHIPRISDDAFGRHVKLFHTGANFSELLANNGNLLVAIGGTKTLDEIFQIYGIFETMQEQEECVQFLHSMLCISPLERGTAKALQGHSWLSNV